MALFGSSRDVSLVRHLNKELLHNIVNQQCAFYKYELEKTNTNIYGESAGGKYYSGPILFNSLINIGDNTSPTNDFGVDFDWSITVALLRDDLVEANVHPEVGDIILYQESYFEIDNTVFTQFWAGKDPDYPYENNPLNPGLSEFGYNVSVVCSCHYVPSDRIGISKTRL
jgi:hypothetical protein